MKNFIFNQDVGLLVFRLAIGITMAFSHGLGKMPPSEQLITGVTAMGFPVPVAFAWAAALSEFLGGLLIAGGLFTRYAAAFLGFTMFIAFFKVHAADPFHVKEMAFLYLASCALLLFSGAGKLSVDQLMKK
ncbi:MAG: DoxX family protein [Xanthomonadaceae bacterium]|nr:DoxX family protein [Xanthomonadaceae bacterium]